MSRKGEKENRNTWIVVQLRDGVPCGVMTDPRGWGSDYVGNAKFSWKCELNQKTTEEKFNAVLEDGWAHKMPKQTADRFDSTLNKMRTLNDIKRGISFKALSVKAKPEPKTEIFGRKRGRPRKVKPPQPKPLEIFYQECNDAAGPYRWWQNNWFSDQFDVINKKELEIRIAAAKMLGVPIHDHLPED